MISPTLVNRLITYQSIIVCLVSINAVAGITINGIDINKVVKKGQVISYKPGDDNADNIAFKFKDGNLQLGTLSLAEDCKKSAMQFFDVLMKQKEELHFTEAKDSIEMVAFNDQKHSGVYLECKNTIFLKAGHSLSVKGALFSAKEIFLCAPKLSFELLFINDADFLQLESTSPDSLFKVIRFTLTDGAKLAIVHGDIDFDTSDMEQAFMVMGVTEVEILFNDSAFDIL